MPLLSLYVNNKAGGLIYHRVRDCNDVSNLVPHVASSAFSHANIVLPCTAGLCCARGQA